MKKGSRKKSRQCPKCYGNLTKIVDVRDEINYIRRRYQCDCGHRFSTHEVYQTELDKMTSALRQIQKALTEALKNLPQI